MYKYIFISFFSFLLISSTGLFSNNEDRKLSLQEFSVTQNGSKTDIKWIMNREPLGTYFTIEKSVDGKTFAKVIDMPVSENGNMFEEYLETDYQPYKGVSYYRIKQTDDAGNMYCSDVITFKYNEEQSRLTTVAMPKDDANFVSAFKNIEGKESLFVLRDADGNDYYSKLRLGKEDMYLYAFAANPQIAPGIYRVVGTTTNQLYSLKVVIK